MILADKIIRLRKKNGLSQEELAEKMNISRQAVSKWESAQSVPDLDRILQLGKLFGVTTDYLLKDEIDNEDEDKNFNNDDNCFIRRVSLSEAEAYINWKKSVALRIAVATFICIFSVIPLIILGAASEYSYLKLSEDAAGGIGVCVLLIFIAAAVAIYISCDPGYSSYGFIDKEPFETEYGVKKMAEEKQKAYRNIYVNYNIIGTCLCIISPIPLFASFCTENDFFSALMLTVMLFIIGIGVIFFIISGICSESLKKLLTKGEYKTENKEKSRVKSAIASIYWILTSAIYIAWSFISDDWNSTWIVWPIAGVVFAAVMITCDLMMKNKVNSD